MVANMSGAIPKKVVQYWDQDQIPDDVSMLMKSWVQVNPDIEYIRFSKKEAASFLRAEYGEEVARLFETCAVPAMRSDFFRVGYILKNGGMYIDAATRAERQLPSEFFSDGVLRLMRKWHGGVWNGFIVANKNDPFLGGVFQRIIENIRSRRKNDVWAVTGPGVINELLKDNSELVEIIDQKDLKVFFSLVNDLKHKKESHWSKIQNKQSIFDSEKLNESSKFNFIVHVGPHETGTTTFQNLLEINEHVLNAKGVSLVTVRSGISEEYKRWRVEYTQCLHSYLLGKIDKTAAIRRCSALFSDIFYRALGSMSSLFLSDENLIGPIPGHFFAKETGRVSGFYTCAPIVLESLCNAAGENRISFVACRRDLDGFLASAYRDFASKLRTSESLLEFYEALGQGWVKDYHDFYSLLEDKYQDSHVFGFEDFVQHPSELAEGLLGFALEYPAVKKQNESMSWRAVELALGLAPLLRTDEERSICARFLRRSVHGESELLSEQRKKINVLLASSQK